MRKGMVKERIHSQIQHEFVLQMGDVNKVQAILTEGRKSRKWQEKMLPTKGDSKRLTKSPDLQKKGQDVKINSNFLDKLCQDNIFQTVQMSGCLDK